MTSASFLGDCDVLQTLDQLVRRACHVLDPIVDRVEQRLAADPAAIRALVSARWAWRLFGAAFLGFRRCRHRRQTPFTPGYCRPAHSGLARTRHNAPA